VRIRISHRVGVGKPPLWTRHVYVERDPYVFHNRLKQDGNLP
jgi:hypothetical protein